MLNQLDKLLDKITMYKLLYYYLIALLIAAVGLSATHVLHFSPSSVVVSTIILVVSCVSINKILAYIFDAPTNAESAYITAFILALIIAPANNSTTENYTFLVAAAGLAMASKYILAIKKKHIFNPAAIAVALTAIGPHQSADWWVGTTSMLPYVIIGGLLLARKINRVQMVFTFFASALIATALYTYIGHGDVMGTLEKTITTSSMFFLGFVMLTEPLTSPPTRTKQTWYSLLTGFIFPPQFHILKLYSTPELALVASNIFSYIISPKIKLFPSIIKKEKITPDSVDFIFKADQKLKYKPGQYMEWTLPHTHTDGRGNRRYFTLASSPTENEVRIGVKFYEKSSSYKNALINLKQDTHIVADQIAGNFTMPKDKNKKLVFIAGGIGVTPYRSMAKYLIDKKESRNIVFLYSARSLNDFAYTEIFKEAKNIGLRSIYFVTGEKINHSNEELRNQKITSNAIKADIPDFMDRQFYISGTQAMVSDIREDLLNIGVHRSHIKTDYFPGYS
jgi:ferredoxin-NADP reductase/Na+-translocating ferredoxin:NAD+ oxidoreductase RnfD subunit